MCKLFNILVVLSVTMGVTQCAQNRVAVAHLAAGNVSGTVLFTESDTGIHVTGSIGGMAAGQYGFHIHELGDISTCLATGAHFNPDTTTHGGRNHIVRHVGDLGNVLFVDNQLAISNLDFTDNMIALRGRNNILGRAIVLHEQEDDLGLGGHELSNSTGNAGARVACGVIGMHAPVEAWNSSKIIVPSIFVFMFTLVNTFLR